jgi:predicted RecA/RadA family phage recombinase
MGQVNDYFINEGNKIGYLPTEFGAAGQIVEKAIKAGVAVKKGNVVEIYGELLVRPTTAASANVLGVAMFDAAVGEPVAVECEGLFKLTASAAITAPANVESAADGKVATAGGTPVKTIGLAITNAVTDGAVYVKFSI